MKSVDHQQQKELHKKEERKQDNKEQKARDNVQEQKAAKGAKIIRPAWLGVVGFLLAMFAMLCWIFFF